MRWMYDWQSSIVVTEASSSPSNARKQHVPSSSERKRGVMGKIVAFLDYLLQKWEWKVLARARKERSDNSYGAD